MKRAPKRAIVHKINKQYGSGINLLRWLLILHTMALGSSFLDQGNRSCTMNNRKENVLASSCKQLSLITVLPQICCEPLLPVTAACSPQLHVHLPCPGMPTHGREHWDMLPTFEAHATKLDWVAAAAARCCLSAALVAPEVGLVRRRLPPGVRLFPAFQSLLIDKEFGPTCSP